MHMIKPVTVLPILTNVGLFSRFLNNTFGLIIGIIFVLILILSHIFDQLIEREGGWFVLLQFSQK